MRRASLSQWRLSALPKGVSTHPEMAINHQQSSVGTENKLLNNSFEPKNHTLIVYRVFRLFWLSTTGAPLFMVKWVIEHFMVGFLVVGWGEIKCAERFVQTHKNSRCLADSLFLVSFCFPLFFTMNSLYTKKFPIKTMFSINFIYFKCFFVF